ncbi:hypothetical protein AAE115_001274 [Salmonella enterica]|nr:hypothetical protein [Salmonella enterica]
MPKIVVDDVNITESTALRFFDKLVLTTLTLKIYQHLSLRRLPDINHGFALKKMCG